MVCSFFLISFKDRRSIAGLNENRLVREVDNAKRRTSRSPGDFATAANIGSIPPSPSLLAHLGVVDLSSVSISWCWGLPVALLVPHPGGHRVHGFPLHTRFGSRGYRHEVLGELGSIGAAVVVTAPLSCQQHLCHHLSSFWASPRFSCCDAAPGFPHAQELRRTHGDAIGMSPWGAPPGEAILKTISWSPTMEMGDARRVHVQQTALCMIISCQNSPSPLGFKPHHPLDQCKEGIKSPIISPQEWPPRSTGAGSGGTTMQSRASPIGIPGDASSFRANHCPCHSIGVGPSSIPGASAAERELSGQVRTARRRAGLREQR